jgi:transcriptional regulator with GAF, ATPase, and Fis domain
MNAISSININEPAPVNRQVAGHANFYHKERSKTIYDFSNIIGSSPVMQKVYHMVSLVAESSSTVLLLGETGTGKGLIADAIHNSSPRRNRQIIKVNCAAMPTNLIESELFGHEKGAFTGAIERRIGKFELANNSTLFLDEIGEMSLDTQVKLLHALQDREITRVGGRAPVKVNVRIIAATNRNLEKEVKAGRFRSDLYYRLHVFPIHLPPLRDRREDIASLAIFFLSRYSNYTGRKIAAISPRVISELENYSWPGNVRELEHLIERSVLLSSGNELREIQLPINPSDDNDVRPELFSRTLQQIERAHIIMALRRCSGKISGKGGAADLLEIPPTTLHSKMKKLAISKADYFFKGE